MRQSDFARLGRLTILLPHFDLRWTLVPRIEAEPPPSLQWWQRLSAVERMLTWWFSGRGESNLRTQTKRPRSQISHLSVKRHSGIAPDPSFQPVGTLASPKMDTYPKGLVDTQHPAVLDDHPVASAQRGGLRRQGARLHAGCVQKTAVWHEEPVRRGREERREMKNLSSNRSVM